MGNAAAGKNLSQQFSIRGDFSEGTLNMVYKLLWLPQLWGWGGHASGL